MYVWLWVILKLLIIGLNVDVLYMVNGKYIFKYYFFNKLYEKVLFGLREN